MNRSLKQEIAKKIFDQIRWDNLADEFDFDYVEAHKISPLEMQLRIKTKHHGFEYLNIKVAGMI